MRKSSMVLGVAILFLALVSFLIWQAVFYEDRGGKLTVSFLDIGQGDSIFIDAPSGRQVLIDGGPPGGGVIQRLSSVMPWYDRTIDVVIPTHPDQDHIGGLIDVLARYDVGMIVHSDVEGDTATAKSLVASMKREGSQDIVARRGQIIDLGDGAYLEILFPDRSVPHLETNTGCVVAHLIYGKTSFMLSCDSPQVIENYLVALDGTSLHADIMKAGHHGSKNSSSPLWLGYVNPTEVVFSRGCHNKYGHPAPEVVEEMKTFGIPTRDTCTEGTIQYVSDGTTVTAL